MLADKLNLVKKNIEEACSTSGRSPEEVTLIAVSKTKPVEMLREAYDAGARVFGENKVQEIMDKYDQMPSDVQWHMIGLAPPLKYGPTGVVNTRNIYSSAGLTPITGLVPIM